MADVIARRIALAGATFEANTHKSVNILSRNKTHKREKYQQTLQKKSERKKKSTKKTSFLPKRNKYKSYNKINHDRSAEKKSIAKNRMTLKTPKYFICVSV